MKALYTCPVVGSSEKIYRWRAWRPRLSGTNKETGEPTYNSEFAPVSGTRREFLDFWQERLKVYGPHRWSLRWSKQGLRRVEKFRPENCATMHSDFAAQLPVLREYLGTCGRREHLNNCVSVVGYKTGDVAVERPGKKWSRRKATVVVRRQHVDVFFGFSAAGYKPDARYYNAQMQDLTSFLKTGAVLHGEWFVDSQRIPGGDHSEALPDGFTEREMPAEPDFVDMGETIEELDGCGCQFACGTQYHQISTSLMNDFGVARRQCKLITKHGKNVCDGASNIPTAIFKSAIQNHESFDSGSRPAVVYMARTHPKPSVPKDHKDDWWAFGRIIYGHYTHAVLEGIDVPEATFNGRSMKCHDFVGTSDDRGLLDGDVPILAREDFCYCDPCVQKDFENCCFRGRLGARMMPHTTCVKKKTTSLIRTLAASLDDWGKLAADEDLVAVRCPSPDGSPCRDDFWLAKPTGPAFYVAPRVPAPPRAASRPRPSRRRRSRRTWCTPRRCSASTGSSCPSSGTTSSPAPIALTSCYRGPRSRPWRPSSAYRASSSRHRPGGERPSTLSPRIREPGSSPTSDPGCPP